MHIHTSMIIHTMKNHQIVVLQSIKLYHKLLTCDGHGFFFLGFFIYGFKIKKIHNNKTSGTESLRPSLGNVELST